MLFKIIRQYGSHGRQGGGVCAVEMALWDLCGKAYGVPAWQLLGGRYRDKIRLYADTPGARDPQSFAVTMKKRVEEQGFTWLKMDLGLPGIRNTPDTLMNYKNWTDRGLTNEYMGRNYTDYANQEHPFTQIQITDKGLDLLAQTVETVRNAVGTEIPISTDHFGHIDMNQAIRIGKAVDKYRLAWMEDTVAWFYTDQLK
jgi:L-alanine-DL-glutamate epimerase-like enolase superfamily enzyme